MGQYFLAPNYLKDKMITIQCSNQCSKSQISIRASLTAAFFSAIFAMGCSGATGPVNLNPRNPYGSGPAPVSLSPSGGIVSPGDLGAAGNYVILAKTGISNNTGSAITGSIGVSPAAASYITGFALVAATGYATSSVVNGFVYAADYAPPTPSNLTTAIGNMQTAYTDAAGRTPPDFVELAGGDLSGLTLTPGLYKWSSNVTVPLDFTISGGPNDIWIFQIAGNLVVSTGKNVILSGGALAKNIFWQVAGQVTLNGSAHFEGTILSKTGITLVSGASLNGRAYAQTAVVLDSNVIVQK